MNGTGETWVVRPISGGSDADDPGETPGGDGATPESTPTPTPAPTYVTREDFTAFQGQMSAMMEELQRGVQTISRAPAPSPAALPAVTVTEEQIMEAVAEGDHAKAARLMKQQAVEREARWEAEKLAPLRDTGLASIAELTRRTTVANLPHYKRFQKEIDAHINNLPAAMRLDPKVIEYAYKVVVGDHMDELVAEAREAAIRKPETPKGEAAPAGARGRGAEDRNRVPTVEEFAGKEAVDALAFRGMDADAFARKLGYAGWADYLKKTSEAVA